MDMSNQIQLEQLQLTDEQTIKEWLERFDALCLLTKVDADSRISALIAQMGPTSYRILSENLSPIAVSATTYADIKNVLLSYKTTETLISVARYKFAKIEQNYGEDVQSLANRLNTATLGCNFSNSKDERLRDQLVVSLKNKDQIQTVLQIKNKDYLKSTFKDLINKIKAIETISIGMSQMTEDKLDIHANKLNQSSTKALIKNCQRCGKSHEVRNCPAFGQICSFCQIPGHFKHMCRKMKAKAPQDRRYKDRNIKFHNNRSSNHTKAKHNTNYYCVDEGSDSFTSILSIRDNRLMHEYVCEIKLNKKPVKFILDTGAQVSVLKSDTAKALHFNMLECTKSLHSFDGKILNVVGKVNVLVEWQGKEKQIEIYVIESNSRFDGLLGQDMLQSFEKKININSIAGTSKIKSLQVDIGQKENAKNVHINVILK